MRGGYGGFGGYRGGYYGGYRGRYGYGYGYLPYGFGYPPDYYWDSPDYYDYSPYVSSYPSYSYPVYEDNPSPNVTVIYPAAPPAPAPTYAAPARPAMRTYDQYGQEVAPAAPAASEAAGSPVYLIAAKDQVIRAAAAYWVDGRTLHYVTLQHEEKQIPLDAVDCALTLQLNRERRVPFQLPQ